MRIKKNFGKRKRVLFSTKPIKKYFLAFEGMRTEVQYFTGIIDNKEFLNISTSVEIIPLLRNHPYMGWSNPMKVFERVKDTLDNLRENYRSVAAIVNSIVEYCFENSDEISTRKEAEDLYNSILLIFTRDFHLNEEDNVDFSDEKIEERIEELMAKLSATIFVENLDLFIKSQFESYDPSFDEVCLIVDRDKNSFNTVQYDSLIEKCKRNNYKLYISNPCFEFWLLLHFNEVFSIDRNLLIQNDKLIYKDENNNFIKMNFAEKELRKIIPSFHKTNLNFSPFINRIDLAIANAKEFATSLENLKIGVGSNVGELIGELRGDV